MMRYSLLPVLACIALTTACIENHAPGNDRESSLDAARPAAELAAADAALDGVSTRLIFPEVLTDADVRSVMGPGEYCLFRFTRVGLPAFLFRTDTGIIKLNGRLVRLPVAANGTYRDGGVSVVHTALDDESDAQFASELVLRIGGAPNELGFHGFTACSQQ